MRNNKKYDYILVGAGLFNAIFAYNAVQEGKKCLVIERRNHIGGNLYCETIEGIKVHRYGAHIFHTKKKNIWEYMCGLCDFNNFINRPLASYKDKLFNLPFNMNTFYQLWGVKTPREAMEKIQSQRKKIESPANLEEQALSLVGTDIYNILIKGYTEKQWGLKANGLPAFLIRRIPLRFTFDNNYFDDLYQGIPQGGYNSIFDKCFHGTDIILGTDFTGNRELASNADHIIYTGAIDQYYDYCYGPLEYRSLKFEDEIIDLSDYQGNAVVNYTEREIPYTRILEHRHFDSVYKAKNTIITREYPQKWTKELEPYYPVNTNKENQLYRKYKDKTESEDNIIFAGRLGSFTYYNMDEIVERALALYKKMES